MRKLTEQELEQRKMLDERLKGRKGPEIDWRHDCGIPMLDEGKENKYLTSENTWWPMP